MHVRAYVHARAPPLAAAAGAGAGLGLGLGSGSVIRDPCLGLGLI